MEGGAGEGKGSEVERILFVQGEVGEELGGDGADVVILVGKTLNKVIPNLIRPIDGFVGGGDEGEVCVILDLFVGRRDVVEMGAGGLVHWMVHSWVSPNGIPPTGV